MAYYGGGLQHPAPPPQLPSQFTSYPPAAAPGALPSYPTPPPQQTASFYPHHHQQQPPARYQQPPPQQQQQQQRAAPAPSRVVPQQPKAPSQREVKRAAEQKAHDVLLRKTLRYLIAAQLSKFLPSASMRSAGVPPPPPVVVVVSPCTLHTKLHPPHRTLC